MNTIHSNTNNYANTRVYLNDKQQQYPYYNNKKTPMQLPVQDAYALQFGPMNPAMTTQLPATNKNRSYENVDNQHRPAKAIPRSTNDNRLFTQAYAPHRDPNQGEYRYPPHKFPPQMTQSWPPAGQYFYSPQYPIHHQYQSVPRPNMLTPPTRKVITIIDPTTGSAINTKLEQKVFELAKATPVRITADIAVLDREAREKKEQEEAAAILEKERQDQELLRKLEQERVINEIEADRKGYKRVTNTSTIKYPAGIVAPVQEEKKHVYSIDFLLQFQQLCLDTTEDLSVVPKQTRRQSADHTKSYQNAKYTNNNSGRHSAPPRTMERQGYNHYSNGRGNGYGNNRGNGRSNGRGGSHGGTKITHNLSGNHVQPLERSSSRWVPSTKTKQPIEGELMSEEYITRKVNALLNKLTLEKFDSISAQIFEYARQSEKETDGKSLRTVIKLTFEKACDEPNFVTMWARLCRTMYDLMTDKIREDTTSGMLLFRKYLFNRCQSEFEKGWKAETTEDLMSDEYYAAAKAKRQGLGLVQFIGELFKMGMLSERIMYTCTLKLCNDPTNASDEEAESLCKLITTIGEVLDEKPKSKKWLSVIISRMKEEMIQSPKLTSRVKFMIEDLLDLRKNKWVPRGVNQIGPATIAQIHEKAKEVKRTSSARGYNVNRNGSCRKENNNTTSGWNKIASNNKNRASDSGKNSQGRTNSPVNVLGRNKNVNENNSDNMFSALNNEEDKPMENKPKLSDQEIKRKSKNILEEYFSINDKKGTC